MNPSFSVRRYTAWSATIGRLSDRRVRWCQWSPGCSTCRWPSSCYRILSAACSGRRSISFRAFLAGAAIDIPADENSASFKWLLLGAALLAWLAGWLCWRLWRSAKTSGDRLTRWLPRGRLLWLSPLMVALAATALTFVFRHPLMPVYLAILHSHRALIPIKCEALLWPLNSSAVAPSQTMRPSATTIERGAMRAASSTLWETISRVSCCCSQTSATRDSISWRSAGSSAEKGSSSSSTGCWRTRQRASAARCR